MAEWFEVSPERLVVEFRRVQESRTGFSLVRHNGFLCWTGALDAIPAGVQAEPLVIRVKYPEYFPAGSPWVEIVSPELGLELVGHEWHRMTDGDVCYIRDSLWNPATAAEEIIAKEEDWYFNFVAKRAGLIEKMPDVGRAEIVVSK